MLDVPSAATTLADRRLWDPSFTITENVAAFPAVAKMRPFPVALDVAGLAYPVAERTRNLP